MNEIIMCSQMKFLNENIHRYFQMYFKCFKNIFKCISEILLKYDIHEIYE